MSIITYDNLEGARLGFLEITRLIRRSPEVVYEAYCHNCQATTTYRHEYLRDIGVCKGRECRLIAERKAAQQARNAYKPVMRDFSECPPTDPRSFTVWEKMQQQQRGK